MKKYFDVVQDLLGNAVVNAQVVVTASPLDTAVSIYTTNSTAGTPVANSTVNTDATGFFFFYAPDGQYIIKVYNSGVLYRTITDVQIVDDYLQGQDGFVATIATIAALRATSITGLPNGQQANVTSYYASTVPDGGGGPLVLTTGAAPGTYVDNGGSIIVPTGGNGSAAWLWPDTSVINVARFGMIPGQSAATQTTAYQNALNAGLFVFIPAGSFSLSSAPTYLAGHVIRGSGLANTSITLTADITPFTISNINDTDIADILVVVFGTQTAPIYKLTSSTVAVTRNKFKRVQVSASALAFTPIQYVASTGATLVWDNECDEISLNGVGTCVELNTSFAGASIRANKFSNFHVNDFVKGVSLVSSAGDGSDENIFKDWGAQASSRTTHGFQIPASNAGQNQYNVFDGFTVYDLPAGGLYYDIGAGVVGTEILAPTGVDPTNTSKFVDAGTRTRNGWSIRKVAEEFTSGHFLQIPTNAGWTEAVTGTGSTAQQVAYNQTRTGTTLNSTARRYTETIGGFASNSLFGINYDKPLIFRFNLARATSEANAVGRVQLKTTQAEGALAAKGFGIRVLNYALYGESYGSAGAFVDLSTTMTDAFNYQIEIRHYPADRIEWWIDGVYKANQSTAADIPSGTQTAYLVHSLITTISNPSGDAQMFLLQPSLWSDL